jgi:hypothetical protein
MERLHSIAALAYAVGWISGILAVIYRILVYSGKLSGVVASTHILPYNLLQLCLLAFVVSIASDARAANLSRSAR